MPYSLELAPEVIEQAAHTLEHFNANHADTVLLLARFAAGAPDATDAEAIAVDAEGVDFEVVVGGSGPTPRQHARMAFDTPVVTADEISAAVLGRIATARAVAGETHPLTSLERELSQQGALPTLVTEVRWVRDLTPNLREIVVGGGLDDLRSHGGDEFAYVFVPRPGETLPADYSMATWLESDPDTRPYGAYYTIRSSDPAAGEATLWAVVHGHHEGVGGWFAQCRPGDRLAMWGPREGFWSEGVYAADPAEPAGRHHLFVTDESGFCAVAALLEGLPAGDTATVLGETVDADHAIAFPGPRTNVRWHYRGAAEPGSGTGLYELVLEAAAQAAPISTAFGAAESRQVTQIRKYLRHTLGMSAARVSMTGYWRRDH